MHPQRKNLRIPVPDAVRSLLRFQPDHADDLKYPVHRRRYHQSKRVVGHPLSRLRLLSDDQHHSSANHTAHKLAEQIKKSGMPFRRPAMNSVKIIWKSILFRKTPAKAHWLTMNLKSWVRTAIISICSAIPTAGIWCRKRGLTQARGPVQIRMRARI